MSLPTLGTKTVKAPVGFRRSYFAPITADDTADAHPTYSDTIIDMGAAVTGTLAVTTASAEIAGDDITQLEVENFVSAQLDVETTCDDLEKAATLYGHTYGTPTGESSGSTVKLELAGVDDGPPVGGYACIEPMILKDKSMVYRASFFFRAAAMASAEKMGAKTRSSSLEPQMSAVSFKITADNTGHWRARQEFATQAAAEAWIEACFDGTAHLNL